MSTYIGIIDQMTTIKKKIDELKEEKTNNIILQNRNKSALQGLINHYEYLKIKKEKMSAKTYVNDYIKHYIILLPDLSLDELKRQRDSYKFGIEHNAPKIQHDIYKMICEEIQKREEKKRIINN